MVSGREDDRRQLGELGQRAVEELDCRRRRHGAIVNVARNEDGVDPALFDQVDDVAAPHLEGRREVRPVEAAA